MILHAPENGSKQCGRNRSGVVRHSCSPVSVPLHAHVASAETMYIGKLTECPMSSSRPTGSAPPTLTALQIPEVMSVSRSSHHHMTGSTSGLGPLLPLTTEALINRVVRVVSLVLFFLPLFSLPNNVNLKQQVTHINSEYWEYIYLIYRAFS